MQITTTDNRITIRHQCPLCCTAHRNGRQRLCNACNRKAWAVDIIGVLFVGLCVAVIGAALLSAGA